jgi:putative Mn2+ efflux pump MntP
MPIDWVTIFVIACSLAMDAFAVSIASGVTIVHLHLRHALVIALFFGSFQAIMPLIGWFGGDHLKLFFNSIAAWIAFFLLIGIGVKMIYEATRLEASERETDPLNIYVLFMLAVATSIDALAVGFSFGLLHVTIITPALIIGGVTFVLSLTGIYIGEKFGHFFEKKIEVLAGLVLIGIGIKTLLTHVI